LDWQLPEVFLLQKVLQKVLFVTLLKSQHFKKDTSPILETIKKSDTQACCHYNSRFIESQLKIEETHQPFDHIHHQRR